MHNNKTIQLLRFTN